MYNFLQPRTGAGGFLKLILAGLVLQVPLATAQFTQVMGTVVDPKGIPYANGTIFPNLIISGSPRFTSSGFPYVPPSQPTGLDAHGSFIMSIADVTQLTPSGGVWSFTVNCGAGCIPPAAGQGPITFTTTGLIISGTVQDISSVLQLAAPPLTGGGGVTAGVSSINGSTGALTFPNLGCTGSTCSLNNPITFTPPTARLTSPGSVSAIGIDQNANSPNGVPAIWATAPNSSGTGWQPIPYIVVNGLTPSNLSAQNFSSPGQANVPAPPTNGIQVTFARTPAIGANLSQQITTAAIIGNGDMNSAFLGTGLFAPPIPGLTSNGTTITATVPLAYSATGLQFPNFPAANPAAISGTPQLWVSGPGGTLGADFFISNGSITGANAFTKVATVPTVNSTVMNTRSFTLTGTAPNTCSATNFPVNGRCIVFYTPGPNTGTIGAAVVGDGNPAHQLCGDGTVANCALGGLNIAVSGSTGAICGSSPCSVTLTASPAAFTTAPTCTATPSLNASTTGMFVSTTITTLTITYTPSAGQQFTYICFGF